MSPASAHLKPDWEIGRLLMKDSPIKSIADLKGKKVAINAYGSAVDLVLRVALKKANLDPRRDLQIVEVTFPSIAAAIREGRVDCGVLVIPFLPAEAAKGDLRGLFSGGDTLGPSSVVFQVATDKFIREQNFHALDKIQAARLLFPPD